MVDLISLAVAAGYGLIRGIAVSAVPQLAGIVDYLLLGIGYWKRDTAWGQGLLFGAVVYLASTLGLGTFVRLGGTVQQGERVIV